MTDLRPVPLAQLRRMLASEKEVLRGLAPYNGSAPGARAVASCRERIETIQAELNRRGRS
jgi:hypothetical protein